MDCDEDGNPRREKPQTAAKIHLVIPPQQTGLDLRKCVIRPGNATGKRPRAALQDWQDCRIWL